MTCVHLREILLEQREIITRHIDRHKWFNHIEDRQEATLDFIEKYGWIMREIYCDSACPDRHKCEYYAAKIKDFTIKTES